MVDIVLVLELLPILLVFKDFGEYSFGLNCCSVLLGSVWVGHAAAVDSVKLPLDVYSTW